MKTVWIQQALCDTREFPRGALWRKPGPALWGTLRHSDDPSPLEASFHRPEVPSAAGPGVPRPLRRRRSGPGQSLPLPASGGPLGAPSRPGVEGEVLGVSPPARKPRARVSLRKTVEAEGARGSLSWRPEGEGALRAPEVPAEQGFRPGPLLGCPPFSSCWHRGAAGACQSQVLHFVSQELWGSRRRSPARGAPPSGHPRDPAKTPRADEEVARPGNDLRLTSSALWPQQCSQGSRLDGYLLNAWRPLRRPLSRLTGVGRERRPRLPKAPEGSVLCRRRGEVRRHQDVPDPAYPA